MDTTLSRRTGPERYAIFNVVGLPLGVQGHDVHRPWAVVANIADHKMLISLATLGGLERKRIIH